MIDFDEYIRQGEPTRSEKAQNWMAAIGLQAVDGLKPSQYLLDTARKNIEGEITIEEARKLVDDYYETELGRQEESGTAEADKVASRINEMISHKSLSFSSIGLSGIHRHLFDGIFKHAGEFRTYNISKKEWVLRGDSVIYQDFRNIGELLQFDIEQERAFNYSGLSEEQMIKHISKFTSDIWEVHPFCEGNTRTTAVFLIQYLRSMGFKIDNDSFARHSWYFRNALVRSNYSNREYGIEPDFSFLERFFANIIFAKQNELKNRYMLILSEWNEEQVPNMHRTSTEQVPNKFDGVNQNIIDIVLTIGNNERSIKEIMEEIGLKHRPNFLNLYITPAICNGFVSMLYPDSPRHPRQKYRLTVKGQMLLKQLQETRNKK